MTEINEIIIVYNCYRPRTYRKNARKDYLNLAKCKKCTAKKIRKAIKRQLLYTRHDFGRAEMFQSDGVEFSPKQLARYAVLKQVYDNKSTCTKTMFTWFRIVSISQPYASSRCLREGGGTRGVWCKAGFEH